MTSSAASEATSRLMNTCAEVKSVDRDVVKSVEMSSEALDAQFSNGGGRDIISGAKSRPNLSTSLPHKHSSAARLLQTQPGTFYPPLHLKPLQLMYWTSSPRLIRWETLQVQPNSMMLRQRRASPRPTPHYYDYRRRNPSSMKRQLLRQLSLSIHLTLKTMESPLAALMTTEDAVQSLSPRSCSRQRSGICSIQSFAELTLIPRISLSSHLICSHNSLLHKLLYYQ